MSTSLFIPSDILETLVCLNCNNYLSIFPIYTTIDNTGASCGRCKIVEESKYIRDEAYECLAQFLVFPCMYTNNGCAENLTPTKLDQHEQCCQFRRFDCPSKSYSKCQWTGARIDLIEHFTQKHPDFLLKSRQFELNFTQPQEETYLVPYNDELFLVKKEIDVRKGIFSCSIEHLISNEESDKYDYFLKIESGNRNYSFKSTEKNTCKDEKLNSTQITADTINERLQGPASVLVTVVIFKSNSKKNGTEGDSRKNDDKLDPNVNWGLLEELECPICFDFMLPPIYQCMQGHSLCGSCKENCLKICAICKTDIKETRNFTLEKMTSRLIFPCKYYKIDCRYSSLSTTIQEHEANCVFGPHACPVSDSTDCLWKEKHDQVEEHIDNNHNEMILKTDKVEIPFERNTISDKVYLIKYNKHIFKLCYEFDTTKFYWCVQLVGPPKMAQKYRFEIDLIDLSGAKLRSYHMGLVVPLTKLKDCFINAGKYVFAPLEQVKAFVTDKLSFRVRVVNEYLY